MMGEAKTLYEVIVVGAGVAGIYQIKRLVDLGIDATVLDSAADLGGTWYWNRYPGCRFDSESYTYGFSFSRELLDEWHWKERFSVRRAVRRASSGRARVPMYKRRPPARPKETDERAEPLAVHHRPRCAQKPGPRAMPRGVVSHHRGAVMARALPLDSAPIVLWNIVAKQRRWG